MAKPSVPKFENRVRFNWGYHDAALVVAQNWQSKNFGFGPTLKIAKPEDVLDQHFDKTYAHGWQAGYQDALNGSDTSSSQPAWDAAIVLGSVVQGAA